MDLGIIGCGRIAKAHMNAIQEVTGIQHVFLFDIHSESLDPFLQNYSKAQPVKSLKDLCSKVSGIIVATPNHAHLTTIKTILEYRNVPVLCEKPLATSAAEARELCLIAPPKSIIGFNYRFNKAILAIIDLAKARSLGSYLFINIAFNKNSNLSKKTISWRESQEQRSSGGVFADLGSHLIDLIQYISNDEIVISTLKLMSGSKSPYRAGIRVNVDDYSILGGETTGGTFFQIKASKVCPLEEMGLNIHIIFERGEISYKSKESGYINVTLADSLQTETYTIIHSPILPDPSEEVRFWADSFFYQAQSWSHWIENDEQNPYPLATMNNGLRVQEVISNFLEKT